MILRGLLDALHRRDFREEVGQHSAFGEHLESAPRAAFGQDADELIADPFGRDFEDQRMIALDSCECRRIDLEVEPRRESYRAQQPEMVLPKALAGISDRP